MKQITYKQFFQMTFYNSLIFVFLVIPALGQTSKDKTNEVSPKPDGQEVKVRGELFKVVETKSIFETKIVREAPYSATVETETIQTLADGNTIKDKNSGKVFRDRDGRTRRESEAKTKGQKVFNEIFISDPLSGFNYTLDENKQIAFKNQVNVREFEVEKKKTAPTANPKDNLPPFEKEKEPKTKWPVKEVPKDDKNIEKFEKSPKSANSLIESLGKKIIEGVECEGKRITRTIPAGEIGNTRPINIISEQWYAPELQILVLTTHQDPRSGETVYRVTNIKRDQPDRSLFEIPANYTVIDKAGFKKEPPSKNKQ